MTIKIYNHVKEKNFFTFSCEEMNCEVLVEETRFGEDPPMALYR